MTDGMEKWQADCNARMSKGNEPGSPAAMLAEIERLTAESERLRAAVSSCQSWIERWTGHVGNCKGGAGCTCGRSAVLFDAANALDQQTTVKEK